MGIVQLICLIRYVCEEKVCRVGMGIVQSMSIYVCVSVCGSVCEYVCVDVCVSMCVWMCV